MAIGADSDRVAYPLFNQVGGGGSSPTSALQLQFEGCSFETAMTLNRKWHSLLPRFGTGAFKSCEKRFTCFAGIYDGLIYCVGIWSLPCSWALPQDESWLELRRFAIAPDSPKNTGSRGLRIMELLIRKLKPRTRILCSSQDTANHNGTIYAAAGWHKTELSKGGEWDCAARPRPKAQSTAPKQRWEKCLYGPATANAAGKGANLPLPERGKGRFAKRHALSQPTLWDTSAEVC